MVDIAQMQYGFMPERGTVDAVFVLGRLSEKFRAKIKLLFIFVDLKKAFDWVSREVICFVLRPKGVPEYLVNGVIPLYKVVKLLMGNYQVHFCESWCPSKVW